MDYLLHHLLHSASLKSPEKTAVADRNANISFSDLSTRSGYLAKKLKACGLRRGDRVAFFCDHDHNQAIAIFGISAAGGVFVPINDLLFPEQVEHIINDSGSRVIITTAARRKILAETLKKCICLEEVWLIDEITGKEVLERHTGSIENDLAAILYTSGSTGKPKGVMLSHKNIVAGCWIVSEYLKLSSEDVLLGILPLSFDYGLNQLITMVGQGGTYRFFTFKLPNDIVNALETYNITGLAGVPSVWALLVRSSLGRKPLPHLKRLTNSGGAVPTAVLEKMRKMLPTVQIFLMYGLTEAFRSTFLPPDQVDRRPNSIGKAIPNTEIIVMSDSGAPCGPDEIGTLVHRGPTVALGYWNRPEETAAVYREIPMMLNGNSFQERAVYSGDLVKTDDEGFLYFLGRRDAMIKVSGHRISPSEIEEVVFRSELVKEVAAIGIPDTTLGQRIKLIAVPVDSCKTDLEEAIIRFCAERLPLYMVPARVEKVDILPKTPTGKIDYPELKRRERGVNE